MKPAAEDAADIIVHYLRQAAAGRDRYEPDMIAEIEGVMQGLIDEAVTRAVADVLSRGIQHVEPQLFNEPVQRGSRTPLIEVPDAPTPLGPTCAKPPGDMMDGDEARKYYDPDLE